MASINDYIDSINYSIDQMRENKPDIENISNDELPSDFKLMMMGSEKNNSKIMQFIFDTRLDKTIDNLLNKLMVGDYSAIDKYSELIKKVFEAMGIGEGAFEGPVAQALMQNITNTLNSYDMLNTKNKIRKCMLILRNLKFQAKSINNPNLKKKYLEAVHALKQTLKFIAKVYKDRRIITNRVIAGLKTAVNEDYEYSNEELDLNFDLNEN